MEKIDFILDKLDELYPNAKCELNYNTEYDLLVAIMLSAQTTDKSVNSVTEYLFKKYQKPIDYVKANLTDLENDIKRLGLYKNKALNIKKTMEILSSYDTIPNSFEFLVNLPGVGRKTANVFLSEWYKEERIAVDTHVERVTKRLGLVKKDATTLETELILMKKLKKNKYSFAHHHFIFFGRYMCKAKNPICSDCPFKEKICKEKDRL